MSDSEIIRRLMKDMQGLKDEQARLASMVPQFTILNVNQPATLTANVNNYSPGDYDILRLISDASPRNISGISGGVDGRILFLFLAGTNTVALLHLSGLSLAANQIFTLGATTITMNPPSSGVASVVMLFYFNSLWRVFFKSAP